MSPYENLMTDRLVLRQLVDEDVQQIAALRSNELVCRYLGRPILQHSSEAIAFIDRIKDGYANGTAYYWAICLKGAQELMGTICLWNFSAGNTVAEVGYELLPEHHGNGYMQEALAAVCMYGSTSLRLSVIDAFTHRDNTPSKNLLERNGFVFCEGRADPDTEDNVVYTKSVSIVRTVTVI